MPKDTYKYFADVIVPLPIYGTFTYGIPDEMVADVTVGCRVLAQFGTKKYYTGIVEYIHDVPPKGYDVKPIMAVLDEQPICRYPQLKLWNWIADYYLCSVGEVFKAAIPSGLKIESETRISLNPDFDPGEEAPEYSEREQMIISALEGKEKMNLLELEKEAGLSKHNVSKIVADLVEREVINVVEDKVQRYRPQKINCLTLTIDPEDEEGLHRLFDLVKKSQRREMALLAFLDLSGWLRGKDKIKEVSRQEVLEKSGVTTAIISAMEKRGIFKSYVKEVNRFRPVDTFEEEYKPKLSELSEAQKISLNEIKRHFREQKDIVLLHGRTGSGKTEIYTHLIDIVLREGRQVLYLVPEIALTTQLTDRLFKVFGHKLLVYHSKFSDNERVDVYNRLRWTRDPVVVIGARSAVFLPFASLGLVIVDEEHESSYKQYDPAPRYNARDVATVLAKMHGAKTLLGSATPSVETFYKAKTGKYGLVSLNERFGEVELPDVEIVDMKEQRLKKLNRGIISEPLKLEISKTLTGGKQAILFQNRRGFAPMVICEECGWTPKCTNCDVSMVYHKNSGQLRCHYCGYSYKLPPLCPACGLPGIRTFGYGTERIAEETESVFPDVRVERMDLDTTRSKDAHQKIIERFSNKETDILVGTQMVSKGLDFANVRLVGVLNADTLLNFPDFRSNERAFNMLEQVSGRAGRRQEKGKVVIQTVDPKSKILEFVKTHDYEAYYESEIAERQRYAYPPFSKVINIVLKHADRSMCEALSGKFAQMLIGIFGTHRILGPEEPSVKRISRYYIRQIMLKVETTASMSKVKNLLRQAYARQLEMDARFKSLIIYYDVDPV